MKYLLDTQALIWTLESDPRLSHAASTAIKDVQNVLYASIVSLWEITIKRSLGKLTIKTSLDDIEQELPRIQIRLLPVEVAHLKTLSSLPYHHKDPFDRLLISQAIAEQTTILSSDTKFPEYSVKLLW